MQSQDLKVIAGMSEQVLRFVVRHGTPGEREAAYHTRKMFKQEIRRLQKQEKPKKQTKEAADEIRPEQSAPVHVAG